MNDNDPFDDDKFDWLDWLMLVTASVVMLYLAYKIFGKALFDLLYSLL